jgi:N-acetylglucosamine kinase-like BadF-type ATPase
MEEACLAVEGGGSKARAALWQRGRLLQRIEWRGLNPGDIGWGEFERRLRALLAPMLITLESRRAPVRACLAVAGTGRPTARRNSRAIARRVVGEFARCRHLVVMSDAEALVEGCLCGRAGVVLVAGTGSVAFGVGRAGPERTAAKVGGRGGLADLGSGFKIGADLIEHCLGVLDGREPRGRLVGILRRRCGVALEDVPGVFLHAGRSQVSSLAPIVLEACRQGDPKAKAMVAQAAADLGGMVLEAKRRAGLPPRFEVHLSGGLFAAPLFRRLFERALGTAVPGAVPHYVAEPVMCVLEIARGKAG